MYIVVCEKPSVSRVIKLFLDRIGVKHVSTYVSGHFMDLDFPEEYNWDSVDPVELFNVDRGRLRYIVRDWRSYNRLRRIFNKYRGWTLIIATDNDSEGELIGYEILMLYRKCGGDRYLRMRFNSIDLNELYRSWRSLEGDLRWGWVYRAMFRQIFDLITGAAFTRLLTLNVRRVRRVKLISWGSCQTPTLYFIVERERDIKNFKPRKYWYIEAEFKYGGDTFRARSRTYDEYREAERVYGRVRGEGFATVSGYREEHRVVKRPLPITTDDLLKDLTKITGMSASRVLSIAEDLYADGYISYPRTETNIWPKTLNLDGVVRAILYSDIGVEIPREYSISPRNGRKSDEAHPPIYPIKPYPMRSGDPKWIIWEYIARRTAANLVFSDASMTSQELLIDIAGELFECRGRYLSGEGFYKIYHYFRPRESRIPRLDEGSTIYIIGVKLVEDETKPPPRLSESSLLELMERNGIGTDATRATFPSLIISRGYAYKGRRTIYPTELGEALIEALESIDSRLVTPETRRLVEEMMEKVGKEYVSIDDALEEAKKIYRELFGRLSNRIRDISIKIADKIGSSHDSRAKP